MMITRLFQKLLGAEESEAEESISDSGEKIFLESQGTCPTCEQEVTFRSQNPWLRDHFLCSQCGSLPRERALMLTLERFYPAWKSMTIHESSPARRGASLRLMEQCESYIGSHYFPDLSPGEYHPSGWRNENLEDQTFDNESFDLVITQDVLEHIPDPQKAFAEISRTLKPGGAHVCTVPLVKKHNQSRPRIKKTSEGELEYLCPPEYHGNPIDGSGSLVTWDWGYDITHYISQWGGLVSTIVHLDDLRYGIRAEYIEVLVSMKLVD